MSWDLPPGTTIKDINDRFGDETHCCDCDKEVSVDDTDDDGRCEECAKVHQEELDEQETME